MHADAPAEMLLGFRPRAVPMEVEVEGRLSDVVDYDELDTGMVSGAFGPLLKSRLGKVDGFDVAVVFLAYEPHSPREGSDLFLLLNLCPSATLTQQERHILVLATERHIKVPGRSTCLDRYADALALEPDQSAIDCAPERLDDAAGQSFVLEVFPACAFGHEVAFATQGRARTRNCSEFSRG